MIHSSHTPWGAHKWDEKLNPHKNLHMNVNSSFILGGNQNILQWVNKLWYIHTKEYYLVIKVNKQWTTKKTWWKPVCALSRVWLFVAPSTVASQAPLAGENSLLGKNTGAGCHFLLQQVFPTQGSNPHLVSPALAGRFFTSSATWEAHILPSRKKPILNSFPMYNFNYVRFWKRQNSGDHEKISGC